MSRSFESMMKRFFGRRSASSRRPCWTRLRLEYLEDRLAPAAVSWTGNAGTPNWSDADNWSNDAVPGSADDVTISKSGVGTIVIGASAYAVHSLNDTTAVLSIVSGGSLSLAAATATSTFGQNVTVNAGATLTVGAGASVLIGPGGNYVTVTLADNGTLTFAASDTVTFNAINYDSTTQIMVGSGGLLNASGTTFNATSANNTNGSNATQIVVNSGGHLQANNSTFAIGQLNLAIGTILNAGDLVGNAFNLPLYIPAIDVQYLSGTANNNLSFQNIDIQSDTLTSGQSVALNAIGTQNTTNLLYIFPSNFTVDQGATLTVGPNVPVLIGPGANYVTVTLADNGTLTFAASDTVTFNAINYDSTTQIVVGSGGLLSASGTTFNAMSANNTNGSNATQIVVNSGGHLQANNSTFAIGQLNLAIGTILNAGDLVGNAFNLPLYIPAIDVQYLSGTANNNLSFQNIDIQSDTLTSGQSVALNAIGTQNTTKLLYIFPGNFTVDQGATLTVGPNVPVLIGPGGNYVTVTLADNGTLTFAASDTVTFNAINYDSTTQIVVGSGGLFSASGTTFNATSANNTNGSNATQIVVNSGGHLQASNSTFTIGQLNLAIGTILNAGDLVGNAFNLPLYIPAIDVQYLSGTANNNLSFQNIDIQSDTLTSGQSVALNAIGTQNTTNLLYIFPGNFTVDQGATLTVGPNVPVLIGPGGIT